LLPGCDIGYQGNCPDRLNPSLCQLRHRRAPFSARKLHRGTYSATHALQLQDLTIDVEGIRLLGPITSQAREPRQPPPIQTLPPANLQTMWATQSARNVLWAQHVLRSSAREPLLKFRPGCEPLYQSRGITGLAPLTLGTATRSYTGLPAPSSLNGNLGLIKHVLAEPRHSPSTRSSSTFSISQYSLPRRQCQQRQLRRDQRPAKRAAPRPDISAAGVLTVILARRASKRGFPRSAS